MIIYEDEELIIPNGIGYSITDADIVNNDEISVFINQNGVKVLEPTEGYTGFSRVTIETDIHPLTQSKTIDSSTVVQHVEPDNGYEALDEVTVNPYTLDNPKTVDSSTNEQVIIPVNDGLSKVIVRPYILEELTLDSSTAAQTRTGQFSTVTVNPYTLSEITLDSSTSQQTRVGEFNKVVVNPYSVTGELTLDSSTSTQTKTGEFATVTVNPYTLESKSVEITENGTVEITPEEADGLSKVQITTNITYSTQAKTVDSSTSTQIITPDSSVDALSKVTVNPYTLDGEKIVDSSTNPQVVLPANDGLSKVVINPYVLSPLEIDSSTATQEYSGQFGNVVVNPYSVAEKSISITENGAAHVYPTDSSALSAVHIDINVQPISQEFTVDSSTAAQKVTPDASHNAISQVTINPYVLDTKTVDSSTVAQVVESSADGLKEVHINPFVLENKVIDSSTVLQQFEPSTGFGTIKVNPYTLQDKDITIVERGERVITADEGYDGLGKLTLHTNTEPILQSKMIDSSTSAQTVIADEGYDGLETVIVSPYTTEIKNVAPTDSLQTIIPSTSDALSKVVISPVLLQDKTVNITNNGTTTVNHTSQYNGLGTVTVVTNVQPTLQQKYVDASTSTQTIVPDASAYGLSKVVVYPYTLEEKRVILSQNGTFDYYPTLNGFKKFTVVNETNPVNNEDRTLTITMNNSTTTIVPAEGYTGLGTVTVNTKIPSDIHNQRKTVSLNSNGTVTVTADQGYTGLSQVVITTNVVPNVQSKVVNSSTTGFTVTADYPYKYLSAVTVNPYTLDNITVDASTSSQVFYPTHDGFASFTVNPVLNVAPGNIREGVSILGVQGTFKGGELQERTANSSTNEQVLTPTNGYYGMSKVTISPYTLQSKTVSSSTSQQTVTFDSSVNGLSSVTVLPYALDSKTVYPSESQQVITSDVDGLESVTVKPVTAAVDPDIVPENIRRGVNILGVTGTIVPFVGQAKSDNITMDTLSHNILPDEGYNAITELTVNTSVLQNQRIEIYDRLYSI